MITFKNVSVKYDDNYALRDISFNVEMGEFVFIIGKTGAGKSTLFKVLTREIKLSKGSVLVFKNNLELIKDRMIPYYRRNFGIVFQDFKLLNDRNVYENVAFAQEVIGVNSFYIRKHVMKVLTLVGLRNKANKMPYELSGGEKQKVAIARAIVNKPKIILADEPTGNLDELNTNEIMELLLNINENGTTVLMITHDLHLVKKFNKRVLKLNKGELISDKDSKASNIDDIIEL